MSAIKESKTLIRATRKTKQSTPVYWDCEKRAKLGQLPANMEVNLTGIETEDESLVQVNVWGKIKADDGTEVDDRYPTVWLEKQNLVYVTANTNNRGNAYQLRPGVSGAELVAYWVDKTPITENGLKDGPGQRSIIYLANDPPDRINIDGKRHDLVFFTSRNGREKSGYVRRETFEQV